ncbi:hypothetical protein [Micromonospora aurantiaca (nom. illeg.)]|uniref:hypothetical protein n=1 Tax=Micromonospora aurantiaca (nom. illeg.) TaxID=47850 RepID=UPI001656E261|nr:hypothetical protein [Micromonospora aurantiaca]MBC9002311.1 hypothetical protein [Micromonospora aurantiaca]
MKVFPVALDSGETASLRFDNTSVWITPAAARWRRLLRWSAGAVLVGLGLTAIAVGAGHAISPAVGVWSTAATVSLIVAGGLGAAVAAVLLWHAERHPTQVIHVRDISAARSEQANGRITVTIEHADGVTHRFTGTGMAGARNAQMFARLLSAAAPGEEDTPKQAGHAGATAAAGGGANSVR